MASMAELERHTGVRRADDHSMCAKSQSRISKLCDRLRAIGIEV